MSLFKIGTLVVPNFCTFISFSNQVFFENMKELSYNPQKDLSNGVWHASIGAYLSLDFKGFIVGSQTNLIITLFLITTHANQI